MKSKIIRLVFLCLSTSLLSCSSFQGPGDYKSPNEYRGPVYKSPRWRTNARAIKNPQTGTPRFIWPINSAKLTQKYSPSHNPSHAGLDLANDRGTPIVASHSGYVVFSGRKYRGYGKMIILEYNKEWATLYAHLDKLYVNEKQYIEKGQVIGTMGRTGRVTGVHLHFELIQDKLPIDPLIYLK